MIEIRVGDNSDRDRVAAFYSTQGSSPELSATEMFVLAEDDATLIGVVRLCVENGHAVLRTMRVEGDYQRQGIGKRMLVTFEGLIHGRDCYCLPYAHLSAFYGSIGFTTIPAEAAPVHLRERHEQYRARGMDALIMKRAAKTGREVSR